MSLSPDLNNSNSPEDRVVRKVLDRAQRVSQSFDKQLQRVLQKRGVSVIDKFKGLSRPRYFSDSQRLRYTLFESNSELSPEAEKEIIQSVKGSNSYKKIDLACGAQFNNVSLDVVYVRPYFWYPEGFTEPGYLDIVIDTKKPYDGAQNISKLSGKGTVLRGFTPSKRITNYQTYTTCVLLKGDGRSRSGA